MVVKSNKDWRSKTDNGRKVEERVRRLRARDRLAIHCVEEIDKDKLYPENTLTLLQKNTPYLMAEDYTPVEKSQLHLLSVSQLPSPQSGKAIIPFFIGADMGQEIGYLLNLDETSAHPARVMRAFAENGNTGEFPTGKNFRLGEMFDSQESAEFYEPFSEMRGGDHYRDHALINAVMQDAQLSGRQMDIIACLQKREREKVLKHNELLVAATPQHIEAIVIPLRKVGWASDDLVEAVSKFTGALSGLEHARNGIILPVMLYHSHGAHQGDCTYIAQGEEECKAAAIDALRVLNKHDNRLISWISMITANHSKRLLGLDPAMPLEEQLIRSHGTGSHYRQ